MEFEKPRLVVVSPEDSESKFSTIKTYDNPYYNDIEIVSVLNNKEALSVVYNRQKFKAIDDGVDLLAFVHDDVKILHDIVYQCGVDFEKFDLVGVAGPSKVELNPPALWHIMGGGFGGGNLHGYVYHDIDGKRFTSDFGYRPHRTVMIDGVYMAMNRKMIESDVLFDEDNPAKFHFYDLDFSLSAHLAGFKVGVGAALIAHESPGLSSYDEEWLKGQDYFLSKFR